MDPLRSRSGPACGVDALVIAVCFEKGSRNEGVTPIIRASRPRPSSGLVATRPTSVAPTTAMWHLPPSLLTHVRLCIVE